ncbi:hypothetical protein QZH41_001903 [Actinostola sp. cb2023]|nr:hypothetical protein QZH41_001903 [Actinostola sp. cb2023]
MDELVKLGGVLGLEGNDLKEFIEQKLAEEREERTKKENQAREERAQDRELRKLELAHELEIRKLEAQVLKESPPENHVSSAKTPKLPAFVDGKDDIDSYLRRFERFATTNYEQVGQVSLGFESQRSSHR